MTVVMTRTRHALSAAMLGLAYFAAAGMSVAFTRYGGVTASLWFASGILIAVLGSAPYARWPGLIAACAIASVICTGNWGMGWAAAIPLAIAKMGEAALGAWLFKQFDNRRSEQFDTFSWFWRFAVSVGCIAPVVSALGLSLVGAAHGKPALEIFLSTCLSNGLGNLAVTPFVLPMASAAERANSMANIRRAGWRMPIAVIAIAGVTAITFSQPQVAFLFVPVIPVMLATIALGRESAVAGSTIIVAIGAFATYRDIGPIAAVVADPGQRMLMVEAYFAATVLTLLPVSADLHAKRRLVERLKASEERFRIFSEQSSDIIVQLNREGRIDYISPAVTRLCGYQPDALIGHSPIEMIVGSDHPAVISANQAMMDEPMTTRTFQWQGVPQDGSVRWFETSGRALVSGRGEVIGTLSIIRDISERKATEEALRLAALTDPLTGLPNRRAFREAIERRSDRLADGYDCLAILDVDHFKRVNDRYGHDGGDLLLRHFGSVARFCLREGDLIARLGGEEFGLLLPDTPIEQALLVCERLRRLMAATRVSHQQEQFGATVSGGVARIDARGADYALGMADRALYEAKAGGRNQLALAA